MNEISQDENLGLGSKFDDGMKTDSYGVKNHVRNCMPEVKLPGCYRFMEKNTQKTSTFVHISRYSQGVSASLQPAIFNVAHTLMQRMMNSA